MEYLAPWDQVDDRRLLDELRRELPRGHVLADASLAVRARRQDRDDVLFEFLDGSGRFAQVHLTYQVEADPSWPTTTIFATQAAWRKSMALDHDEYEA